MEQKQKDDDEAAQARTAAQAVLRLAEERETLQSPLKSPLKSLNARLSATKQQIQKEINEELVELNKDYHSTKEQIGNAIEKARASIIKKTSVTTPTSSNGKTNSITDEKILADLVTVEMKITLCGLMISETDQRGEYDSDTDEQQGDSEETLLDIIGYLEACAPRMEELIEAGMDGALQAESVQACLVTSERLHLMLKRCDLLYAAAATEMNEAA